MKKKGFTLIELLAVIVVLAIIALIATPLVLNTIEDSRKGSAKSSGYTYISELETSLAKYMLNNGGTSYTSGLYDVFTLDTDLDVSLKGDTPSEGNICIASNGIITNASLKINGYIIDYDGKEITTSESKEIEDITCTSEVALTGTAISEKAKALVYDENGTCKIDADASDTTTYKYMDGCYIKGESSNNYVWYNGFMWRIMGINSDGTVRLITDENVTSLAYGPSGTGLTYTTNEGYIHDWLNEYFYKNLNRTKNIIKVGEYFCSETTTDVSNTRNDCTNGTVRTKIGLISLDEYNLANAASSYLNINQTYWTMTPINSSVGVVRYHDNTVVGGSSQYFYGVRPVINVSSDAIVTSGTLGTSTDFYVLGEDKTSSITGTLSEKATSGEYVSLKGKTYRVVSKDNTGVKLILDGFYEETEGTIYTMNYGSDNTFTLDSGIGKKLNGDVLAWLDLDSKKIVTTTYYQGDGFDTGTAYTYILNQNKNDGVEATVGLIEVGDILASQSSTMLTKNYIAASSYGNTTTYWTMNKLTADSNLWSIHNVGIAESRDVTYTYALRPVIIARNNLEITGGNGTWNNPYQI